ncbi:RNA polymerase sigma-70 factor [Mycobacterium basiliense]|uniref:RNA polymerase sigma-70 factor n=1 Tax=Mycobacterium basiliense TaxID=2094119 RepID=A0A447GIF1_9MYCO|nr:nuclear transport factor 2 family protein [Mycobacterium basiliense]VDM90169.1 RNA polymerase sigma-70 factor [Mycobacterium basiliense]
MTNDADVDLVRRVYAAFARGDLAEVKQCLAADVEQVVPGKHPLAGVFRGVDQVIGCLSATVSATAGTMEVTLEEVFSNADGQVIAVDRSRGSRNDKFMDQRVAILFTIADGRISRFREFYADPAAMESFWA